MQQSNRSRRIKPREEHGCVPLLASSMPESIGRCADANLRLLRHLKLSCWHLLHAKSLLPSGGRKTLWFFRIWCAGRTLERRVIYIYIASMPYHPHVPNSFRCCAHAALALQAAAQEQSARSSWHAVVRGPPNNTCNLQSDPSQRLLVQCKYCQSRALSDKVAHLIGCTVFEQQHPALYAEVEEQQGGRAVTAPPAPAAAGGLAASSGSTAAAPAGLSGSNRSRTLHGWVAKGNASSAAGQDQQIHAALLLFFVMCNIPFRVVESPHFLRLLNQLRPNYSAQSGSARQPFQRAQLRCRCRCRRRRRRNSRLPTAVRQLASWPLLRRLLLRR